MRPDSVSVVIPAYFEEKTISAIVEQCLPFVDEVIVVNDGSTDDTSKNARNSGAHVIDLPQNMGARKAVISGLQAARGYIIVTIDADGQHDPNEIPKLVQPILEDKTDLVMGVRPYFPHLSERILTWLTSLRVQCSDVSTGFRAIKKEIVEKMQFPGVCLCGTFVLEANRLGARISSVPISTQERDGVRRIQTRHIRQFFHVIVELLHS
jgi:glycosyltransferase involved in cell wall biosynthesis